MTGDPLEILEEIEKRSQAAFSVILDAQAARQSDMSNAKENKAKTDQLQQQIDAQQAENADVQELLEQTQELNKKLVTQLRDQRKITAELRRKNSELAPDANLVNQSLVLDLEQLTAQREDDLLEVDTILANLTKLIEE